MRFACDSCHAQYQISDEKVGPNGVIVRCKKCQHKIVVKPRIIEPQVDERPEATVVMPNPAAPLGAGAGPDDDDDEATAAGDAPFAAASAGFAEAGSSFAGLDDELGRAFESVLTSPSSPPVDAPETTFPGTDPLAQPSGFPFSTASDQADEEDPDRQSTRVVNLAQMASLMKPEPPVDGPKEPFAQGMAEGTPPGAKASEKTDWYVAIRDQQVGPLDFDRVRERWDAGELSADSLVWNAGMTDWRPLSTVAELADKLVPLHKPEPSAPEQPGAADSPASSSALPPPQAEPEEPAWRPSAASALEALVKDELDALESQAAKQEPPVAEVPPAPAAGLFDEVPDAPEPPLPMNLAPSAPPSPEPAAAAGEADLAAEPDSEWASRPVARAPARRSPPRVVAAGPAYSPPSYVPPPQKPRLGLWVGLGIAGGIGVAALGLVLVMFVLKPAVVVPPESVATQQPPALQPSGAPGDPNPARPDEAAQADEGKPAEKTHEVAQGEEAARPDEKKADDTKAEQASADEPKASPPKEAPAVQPADRSGPKENKRSERRVERRPEREPKRVARDEPPAREKEPEPAPEPKPESRPEPKPEPVRPSGSSVDDDFDRIFGGSTASATPEPKREEKRPSTVYIPPPPGGGATKETLGQSDIMEVVLANRSSIKRCTDEQKAREPGSAGTITMRWIIRKDGKTSGIRALTSEYQKSDLSACLAGVIKRFKFPPYSGKQMQPIDFPFKF